MIMQRYNKSRLRNEMKCYNIVLAGNPNVGKSTVFNALTGMNQHTGNWTGKTVTNAVGEFEFENTFFKITDLPGTYSILSNSAEEAAASDYLLFSDVDAAVVVVDCCCLERNLSLVFQVCEAVQNVVICVNLLDEADKKGIIVDLDELSIQTGAETIGICAKNRRDINKLCRVINDVCKRNTCTPRRKTSFSKEIENEISALEAIVEKYDFSVSSRFTAIKIIEGDEDFSNKILSMIAEKDELIRTFEGLKNKAYDKDAFYEEISAAYYERAEKTASLCVRYTKKDYDKKDRLLDKIFTSRITGIPIMILMLGMIFLITISLANYPSRLLSELFSAIEKPLSGMISDSGLPAWVHGILIDGMYRTLSWVVAVMLPPMAIFFPLFTILEDFGYLPRVAFDLDKYFHKSGAHGKQSLTM